MPDNDLTVKMSGISPWSPLLGVVVLWAFIGMGCSVSTDAQTSSELLTLFKKNQVVPVPALAPPMDIVLKDLNNNPIRLSDYKGKIVFLNFWATWCPTCRVEMPAIQKLHERLKNRDFVILAVDLKEHLKTVQLFAAKHKLTFPILLDQEGAVGLRYGIRSIPTTFIIDKKGAIIGKAFGPRHWDNRASLALFGHLIDKT